MTGAPEATIEPRKRHNEEKTTLNSERPHTRRIQLDLGFAHIEQLDWLVGTTHAASRAEVLRNALNVYDFAVQRTVGGDQSLNLPRRLLALITNPSTAVPSLEQQRQRVQLDLALAKLEQLDRLVSATAAGSRADVLRAALELYHIVVIRTIAGKSALGLPNDILVAITGAWPKAA